MLLKSNFLYGEDFKLRKGVLIIEDGMIKGFTNEAYNSDDVFEFKGFVIPPLINAHTHIADNSIKDIGINKSLDELVKPPNGLKHKYLSGCDEKTLIEGIRFGLRDMRENGIKYFCDFRENGILGINILKKAMKKEGIERCPKGIILGRPTNLTKKDVEEVIKSSDGLGLSGANEFKDEDLKMIFKIFKKFEKSTKNNYLYKKLFSIHVAEHLGAVNFSLEHYGKTEVERLIDLGVKPDFVIHGTHLTDEDIILLNDKKIPVVVCVRANLSFNVGMPNLKKMSENLLLGIGTDNFMANSPSLFKEMDFIYKLYHLDPKDILRMATINNAKILNIKDVGLIDEGFKGVFTFIKKSNSVVFSRNIVASIITRCEKGDIANIWI
ncbi:MAG: amidohydrolase family protein [Methanococci archaeon]|nr:amidohydrolase family protein [Methanococci archaeon]